MAHPIPKELKGEERLFTIPYINLHFSGKDVLYCGVVTLIAYIIGKVFGKVAFIILALILNSIAYPISHLKTKKNEFEGGNIPLDRFIRRKYLYKYNKNIYIRKRGE